MRARAIFRLCRMKICASLTRASPLSPPILLLVPTASKAPAIMLPARTIDMMTRSRSRRTRVLICCYQMPAALVILVAEQLVTWPWRCSSLAPMMTTMSPLSFMAFKNIRKAVLSFNDTRLLFSFQDTLALLASPNAKHVAAMFQIRFSHEDDGLK